MPNLKLKYPFKVVACLEVNNSSPKKGRLARAYSAARISPKRGFIFLSTAKEVADTLCVVDPTGFHVVSGKDGKIVYTTY